ncbi:hypothetical protein E1285_29355 [Actinomadura sp. 7K507]|nr:hypothetical protein E1285_29355 [Actinomadura sp. 7K507]
MTGRRRRPLRPGVGRHLSPQEARKRLSADWGEQRGAGQGRGQTGVPPERVVIAEYGVVVDLVDGGTASAAAAPPGQRLGRRAVSGGGRWSSPG